MSFYKESDCENIIGRKMEGKKQVGSSSSSFSFTSELFGSNDSSSTSGIFGSIFAPSSKVLGRESIRPEVVPREQNSSANKACKSKFGSSDAFKSNEDGSQSTPNRDMSSEYQEQRVQQPCHLSSSIYYGGQDVYNHPESTQNCNVNTLFKKDVTEDDSGSASRGNWWQGSLYY